MYKQPKHLKDNTSRAATGHVGQKKKKAAQQLVISDNRTTNKVQKALQSPPTIQSINSENPVQRKLLCPRISSADIANNGAVANTDPVAVGPARMESYTLSIKQSLDNREEAIEATRDIYAEVGELTTEDSGYLCDTKIGKLTGTDQHKAIYAAFQNNALLPLGAIPAQRAHLDAAINPLLTSANIDHIRNNRSISELIDPFKINIHAEYGDQDALSTQVEFTEGQKGYISKVVDTGNGVDSIMEDRANYAGEHPHPAQGESERRINEGKQEGMTDSYSNIHHTKGGETMKSLINGISDDSKMIENEAGIDGYTKLIAEGGRFKCIAKLGTNLTNESLFFTKNGNKYHSATFQTLWGKWSSFNTKYSIEDETVKDKMSNAKWTTESRSKPAQSSRNYDLDKGCIW
jgi:hypothetical protein